MAQTKPITVMLSSRIRTCIGESSTEDGRPISEARQGLKDLLHKTELFGTPLFQVLTSEAAEDAGLGRTETAWNKSISWVREADVVLVIYTGEAGWAPHDRALGICHAEYLEAWNSEKAKLKVLRVEGARLEPRAAAEAERDQRFRLDIERDNPNSPGVRTADEIVEIGSRLIWDAVVGLLGLGRREARRGDYAHGAPLDWSRLDYSKRKDAMEKALAGYFSSDKPPALSQSREVIPGCKVLFICHAIPAALSVATAREMVGQPFLKDHEHLAPTPGRGKKLAGPVHLIACHEGVTETQAMRQLGFPDATIVKGDFGVYVADEIQKIQMVFLANCRDLATTLDAAGKLFSWLEETGEAALLARRAEGRAQIVKAILAHLPRNG